MNRVLHLPDGSDINLLLITDVSPIGGDKDWQRYVVNFIGGQKIEIYEKRKYSETQILKQMPRIDFIKAWTAAITNNDNIHLPQEYRDKFS